MIIRRVWETLRRLAKGCFEIKCYQKALENYSLYVEMQKMLHGEFHPSIVDIYFDIGDVQRALEDYEGMLHSFLCILEISKITYGEESKAVETNICNIRKHIQYAR